MHWRVIALCLVTRSLYIAICFQIVNLSYTVWSDNDHFGPSAVGDAGCELLALVLGFHPIRLLLKSIIRWKRFELSVTGGGGDGRERISGHDVWQKRPHHSDCSSAGEVGSAAAAAVNVVATLSTYGRLKRWKGLRLCGREGTSVDVGGVWPIGERLRLLLLLLLLLLLVVMDVIVSMLDIRCRRDGRR